MNDKTGRGGRARSARLRREAGNCIEIAIRESEPETAMLLIDEALRLAKRARELGGTPAIKRPCGDPAND